MRLGRYFQPDALKIVFQLVAEQTIWIVNETFN